MKALSYILIILETWGDVALKVRFLPLQLSARSCLLVVSDKTFSISGWQL